MSTPIIFQPAQKYAAKLRMGLIGPSKSGKTYTALNLATRLCKRVAVADTERGSAAKYAPLFTFDTFEMRPPYTPLAYRDVIAAAAAAGYDGLVIDSLSHAWFGTGGELEMVNNIERASKSRNSYFAWRDVTPEHTKLIDAMLQADLHLIVTMRAKTEYVLEVGKDGKTKPVKVGTAPVMREGMEYEFDICGDLTVEHDLIFSGTRCPAIDGQVFPKPGAELAEIIRTWLDGKPALVKKTVATAPADDLPADL